MSYLNRTVSGASILDATTVYPGVLRHHDDKKYTQATATGFWAPVQGASIIRATNRAKYLLLHHSTGHVSLHHQSFTGWFIAQWSPDGAQPRDFIHKIDPKETRFTLNTDRGELIYIDPRTLSKHYLFESESAAQGSRLLRHIGPDADTEAGQRALRAAFKRTNRKLRDVLLDQAVLGGIGNYLVSEILHHARMSGSQRAKSLTPHQAEAIITSIAATIATAASQPHQNWHQAFRRKNCQTCQGPVTRLPQGNRGHYFCAKCQGPWTE